MKKVAFRFLSVLLVVSIFMITMEIFARAYFRITSEDRMAIRGSHYDLVSNHIPRKWVAHPIYTYVSSSNDSNNLGFFSPYDYPYIRQKNDFVIGIFGGSVADFMVRKAGELRIAALFKEQIPALRDKNVIFLNFAVGCGKQPMQYQRFSHFAEDIDYAVSIEGYNEVAANEAGAEIRSPCKMLPVYGEAYTAGFFNLYERETMRLTNYFIQRIVNSAFYNSSSAMLLVVKMLAYQRAKQIRTFQQKNVELAKVPESKLYPFKPDTRDLYTLGAINWAYYSRLQMAIAKELKVPALVVIQPNRWVKNSKPLTQAEIEVEMDKDVNPTAKELAETSPDVTRGYNELSRQMLGLQKKYPQNFVDLSFMFKDNHETLYNDACCHFNNIGYRLIWSEIAKLSATRL